MVADHLDDGSIPSGASTIPRSGGSVTGVLSLNGGFESYPGDHLGRYLAKDAGRSVKPMLRLVGLDPLTTHQYPLSSPVERLFYMQGVGGSIPSVGTIQSRHGVSRPGPHRAPRRSGVGSLSDGRHRHTYQGVA